MSILQNIGGDVDSNHPQNTRNGCSPLNNQAGADSSLPNVNGAANTGLSNTMVGFYDNHSDTTPSAITLSDLVNRIRDPDRDTIRNVADAKRAYSQAGGGDAGKRAAKPFKAHLGCVTMSATGTRTVPDAASGLINIDLDELGDRLADIREKLTADAHIAITPFVSPSGDGLKAAMRVPVIPSGPEDKMRAQHKRHFEAVQNYCKRVLGIELDSSTSDLLRLCYLSDDPRCTLKPNAQELDINKWTPPEEERPENQSSVPGNTDGDEPEIVPTHVAEALLMSIPARPDRDAWLKISAAVRNSLGSNDTAIDILRRWSPEEEPGEYARLLEAPFPKIGFGTLHWYASKHGFSGVVKRFFYGGKGGYCVCNKDGDGFVPLTSESAVKQHLREYHVPKLKLDSVLCRIREEQLVEHIGPIAGHKPGLHKFNNDSFLVTQGPTIIEGKAGSNQFIVNFFRSLLDDEDYPEQYDCFLNWLAHARRAVLNGRRVQTPALALTGARHHGKTLAIEIIKRCLGGRSGKAYKFLSGDDQFNSELAGAELLVSDDDAVSKDHRARVQFAKEIKGVLFSASMRVRGMFRAAFDCAPVHALVIATNDKPDDIRVLPELDESMKDKIVLLKTSKAHIPSDPENHEESIRNAINASLPGFLCLLDKREMATAYNRGRLKCFWHPEILAAIKYLSPEQQFFELIQQVNRIAVTIDIEGQWQGTAADLSALLTDKDSPTCQIATKLLSWPGACGTYLTRLAEDEETGISLGQVTRDRKIQTYIIRALPEQLQEEEELAA